MTQEETIAFRTTTIQKTKLQELADQEYRTISAQVRLIVDKYLDTLTAPSPGGNGKEADDGQKARVDHHTD